jgi:hypothetical protein
MNAQLGSVSRGPKTSPRARLSGVFSSKKGNKMEKNCGDRRERNLSDLSDKVASQDVFEGYGGRNESLYSYSALMGVFGLIFALFLLLCRVTGRPIPERIEARDIALLGMAAHKMSMVGSQDAITSPLRAPVTEIQEKESPKNVVEKPRGEGLRRSVGELLVCKFCLGVWLASFLTYGLVLVPRLTRLIATLFAVVTVSDYLHQSYKILTKRA